MVLPFMLSTRSAYELAAVISKGAPDLPTVMIYQSPRPAASRAAAVAAVTDALVGAYGLRPEQIQVYFHEVPDDRWARGGVLASEREAESTPGGK
jgi:phenylpyruvate tautomerase PptA (4-oxalocrotonate tautomerase family)